MTQTRFASADILAWRDFIRGGSEDPPVKAAGLIFMYCTRCRVPAEYRAQNVKRLHQLGKRDGWVILDTHPKYANTTRAICSHCAGFTVWRSLLSEDESDGVL